MNLRRHRRETPDVNLTPLIDVVFLLLIFFMVSTTFEKETPIQIQLPQASPEKVDQAPSEVLDITVDIQGRFYVNQREVVNREIKTLKRAIEKAAADKRDMPVVITADAKAPYQSVITVMDAASQLGFKHMSFPTVQPPADR